MKDDTQPQAGQGITLCLGIFFDGTGNNRHNVRSAAACHAWLAGTAPDQATQRRCEALGFTPMGEVPASSYGNDLSNIARLHALYRDQAEQTLVTGQAQASLAVYIEGVGTQGAGEDSPYSQGTGRWSSGALARVAQTPAAVRQRLALFCRHNPQVRVARLRVDLFGFSRGAAQARHFANDLLRGAGSQLAEALPAGLAPWSADFAWRAGSDVQLNFIGLFDTVAAIVSPLAGNFSAGNDQFGGLQLGLAPGSARRVIQLVAADEQRENFALVQSDDDIALPGAHADLGGGYLPRLWERVLLSRPDSCLAERTQADASTAVVQRVRQLLQVQRSAWQARGLKPQLLVWSKPLAHNRLEGLRAEKRVFARVQSEREVFGHLSRVYLRIMQAWALRYDVPLAAVGDEDALAIPEELQPIAARLREYALGESQELALEAGQRQLLYARYVHCSAHWGTGQGERDRALDALYLNRPAPNGRTLHRND